MNPHRENGVAVVKPQREQPIGFGWALCILAGAALAVGALLLRMADAL